jgi:hypothetical protein
LSVSALESEAVRTKTLHEKGDIAMQRIAAIVLFIAVESATTVRSLAQDHEVKVNMRFDLTVGDKLLPGGNYVITPASADLLEVRNPDSTPRS